eukprot:2980994-Rhodomonas_salina.2
MRPHAVGVPAHACAQRHVPLTWSVCLKAHHMTAHLPMSVSIGSGSSSSSGGVCSEMPDMRRRACCGVDLRKGLS